MMKYDMMKRGGMSRVAVSRDMSRTTNEGASQGTRQGTSASERVTKARLQKPRMRLRASHTT